MSNSRKTKKTSQKKVSGPKMKRNIKDSVFTRLFSEQKYQIELLKTLCPGEEIKPEDIKVKTLKPVLVDDIYNDLCLLVKDKTFIFVEAQSTHSPNMVMRMLLYWVQTYQSWCIENDIDIYQDKIIVPKFRMWEIYTGNNKRVPEFIDLFDVIPSLREPIRILKGSSNPKDDIISEYVGFCKIASEQAKLHPDERDVAIIATLEECKKRGILTEFLGRNRAEVIKIMQFLFDQKTVIETYGRRKRAEGLAEGKAEGLAEGKAEGLAEGKAEGMNIKAIDVAKKMLKAGIFTLKQIAEMTDLSTAKVRSLKAQL